MERDLSTEDMRPSATDNFVLVSQESLMPIVSTYLTEIKPVQWTLLGAGILSPELEQLLKYMIQDVVDASCQEALCTLSSMLQEHLIEHPNEINEVLGHLAIQVEDSLQSCFAEILNFSVDENLNEDNFEIFIKYIQDEVFHRVTLVLDWAGNDEEEPLEETGLPLTLHLMVLNVAAYLKTVVTKLNPSGLKLCCSWDTTNSVDSEESEAPAPSLNNVLDDIVQCWFEESCTSEHSPWQDLSHTGRASEAPPSCNLKGMFQAITDFFAKDTKTDDQAAFCTFVHQRFIKLILELRTFIKQDGKEVCLSQEMSPLYVNQNDQSEPSVVDMTQMMSLSLNLEMFKDRYDRLSPMCYQPVEIPVNRPISPKDKMRAEINKLSKDLVNKLFGHLIAGQTYKISTTGIETSVSDPVIFGIRRREDSTCCSPEVLYSVTELVVLEFINELMNFFMSKSNVEMTSESTSTKESGQEPRVLSPLSLVSKKSEEENDRVTRSFISSLITKIIKKAPRKMKKSIRPADITRIVDRLSDKVKIELNNSISFKQKRLKKVVIQSLIDHYGSEKKILKVALKSDSGSFDATVVRYLKSHQNCPPQKNAVSRLFSAFRKALTKPFKMCYGGN